MGKSKKLKSSAGDLISKSALPLDLQIEQSKRESGRDVARMKQRKLKRAKPDVEYIDESLSNKILKTAWKQKQDIEEVEETQTKDMIQQNTLERIRKVSFGNDSQNSLSDDDFISDNDDCDDAVLQINPEDEAAVEKFMSKTGAPSRTLNDIIIEKIEKKKTELELRSVCLEDADFVIKQLDPAVVEMYREIGLILSRYRSGKIPKAFKVLPKMMNWEHLLYLTNPDKWSAAAMYQATRIFASNLHARMCQRFYNLVLLPRLRDDIAEYKKLNFHLFQALHKAIYKPQAFFKGILLPLCESGTCTLREATIFGSVLTKASIPVMHAAVAMLKIANMEYTGSNSLFLRILIDKKYALPYRAIDALVKHYLRFRKEERQLPVLWHQSLLAFAQRYKNDINDEQRVALMELTKVQNHYQITPEVCRELMSGKKKESKPVINCWKTLTLPPWVPKKEENIIESIEPSMRVLVQKLIKLEKKVRAPIIRSNPHMSLKSPLCEISQETNPPEWTPESNRVGMLARKIGMFPQWGVDGTRFLCTLLEFPKNLVISAVDPETYHRLIFYQGSYISRISMVGRRKAYGRYGPRWRITVGAVDGDPTKFTAQYRATFERHGFPVKKHLASFLVTEDAVVQPGTELHVCHFKVGQYVTATGHTIDWGFQGGMHRWGFKGMPARRLIAFRTTKSHRRIGAIGSKGDARVRPGKRMPGHMGYEWRSIPGLEVLRINPEKQVMYVNGSVPGETGEILLIKDCYHDKKKVHYPHFPTFFYEKDFEAETKCDNDPYSSFVYENGEFFSPRLFRMTMPSIVFAEPENFKTAKRDKTKAKTAKVKK